MKSIEVDFKKIDIVDYFSQLDQVKVRFVFNDGKEKALVKQISITDPSKQAGELLSEIRLKLKQAHSVSSLDDHPLADVLVLRFRQEEDVLHEKAAKFLAQVRERIRSGRLANLSYYDLEKKINGFSVNLN